MVSPSAPASVTRDGVSWGILLQALSTSAAANLLSTPSIITLDNQESEIIVGQNVPFRTGQSTVVGDGTTNPFTTIERRDIGLTLKVTPTISADGLVRLVVEQTTENVADSIEDASDIVTNKREIKTTVLADDGETIVLGGLTRDDYQVNRSKVPLLGDIPFIGRLFSSESERRVKRNLLVFLRPKIMLGKEEAVAATSDKFNQLWDVNLNIREKLGVPTEEQRPTVDALFEGGSSGSSNPSDSQWRHRTVHLIRHQSHQLVFLCFHLAIVGDAVPAGINDGRFQQRREAVQCSQRLPQLAHGDFLQNRFNTILRIHETCHGLPIQLLASAWDSEPARAIRLRSRCRAGMTGL